MIDKKCIEDVYKFYEESESNPVHNTVFRKIINGFNECIIAKVLDGYDVQLSGGDSLGILCIRGKKQKLSIVNNENTNNKDVIRGALPDWKATKELWKRDPLAKEQKRIIYHLNEHSNGISYSFEWIREKAKLINKNVYSFQASRGNKRKVPEMIREGKEYFVVTEKIKDNE